MANWKKVLTSIPQPADLVADAALGSINQVLGISSVTGTGELDWIDQSGGITDIVSDTSPQLGADLDTNGNNIQFDNAHGLYDDSSNETLLFTSVASAVNYVNISNSGTTLPPHISAEGDNANISLVLNGKGQGRIKLRQGDGAYFDFPAAVGTSGEFLRYDGTWQTPPDTNTNTNNNYAISCVDGDNTDEEKIRITQSGADGAATDDVVIEAGTGMSIARSGDKITLTNTVADTDTDTTYAIATAAGSNGADIDIDLTAGGAGSGTDSIGFVGGTNCTITQSGDLVTVDVDQIFNTGTAYGITVSDADSDGDLDIRASVMITSGLNVDATQGVMLGSTDCEDDIRLTSDGAGADGRTFKFTLDNNQDTTVEMTPESFFEVIANGGGDGAAPTADGIGAQTCRLVAGSGGSAAGDGQTGGPGGHIGLICGHRGSKGAGASAFGTYGQVIVARDDRTSTIASRPTWNSTYAGTSETNEAVLSVQGDCEIIGNLLFKTAATATIGDFGDPNGWATLIASNHGTSPYFVQFGAGIITPAIKSTDGSPSITIGATGSVDFVEPVSFSGGSTSLGSTNTDVADLSFVLGSDGAGALPSGNATQKTAICSIGSFGSEADQFRNTKMIMNGSTVDIAGQNYGSIDFNYADGATYAHINDDGVDGTVPGAFIKAGGYIMEATAGTVFKADATPTTAGVMVFDGTDVWIAL